MAYVFTADVNQMVKPWTTLERTLRLVTWYTRPPSDFGSFFKNGKKKLRFYFDALYWGRRVEPVCPLSRGLWFDGQNLSKYWRVTYTYLHLQVARWLNAITIKECRKGGGWHGVVVFITACHLWVQIQVEDIFLICTYNSCLVYSNWGGYS